MMETGKERPQPKNANAELGNEIYRIENISDIEEHDDLIEQIVRRLLHTSDRNDLESAYEIALYIKIPAEKAFTLLRIVDMLALQGAPKEVIDASILEIRSAIQQMQENWQKSDALCEIALIEARRSDQDKAMSTFIEAIHYAQEGEASGNMQMAVDCAKSLSWIAKSLDRVGEQRFARDIATSIQNEFIRSYTLKLLNSKCVGQSQ